MPPKRGTPTRSSPKRPSGAARAAQDAATARVARAARLQDPEPEPEPRPGPPVVYSQATKPDPWAALAKVLRGSRDADDETDDDDDDADLIDTSQRGRKLLEIEAVDSERRPPDGANDDRLTQYYCLWEMNGVVLKYRQRTWETLDSLWDLGEDVRNLIRGYERDHPGTTDLVLDPLSDDDSLQEQEQEQQVESYDNLQKQATIRGEQTADQQGAAAGKERATVGGSGRWYRVRNRCAVTAECAVLDPETVEIIHECVHGPLSLFLSPLMYGCSNRDNHVPTWLDMTSPKFWLLLANRYAIGTRIWVEEICDGAVGRLSQAETGQSESNALVVEDASAVAAEGSESSATSDMLGATVPRHAGGKDSNDCQSGKLRARTEEGWVSLVANDGTVLLVACDSKSDMEEQRDMEELGEWL